jgi:hypothetical protein
MEDHKIKFEITTNGIPVIELGKYGRLSFSKMTAHEKFGYKYIVYINKFVDTISMKNTVGERTTLNVPTNDSYVVNMHLQRNTASGIGLPHNTIPQRLKEYLKKKIESYLDNEYFPYHQIEELKNDLDGKEIETILGKIQKTRKKRKKKKKD